MPPPEVWGPATWNFFHTMVHHLREDAFASLGRQLFDKIRAICSALPCPTCTEDATRTLAKVKDHDINTRKKLIDTMYLFHNYVNAKKNKPLFNYQSMAMYQERQLLNALQYFQANYHTRGNMSLMNESLQRTNILKDLRGWLKQHLAAFVTARVPPPPPAAPSVPAAPLDPSVLQSIPLLPGASPSASDEPSKIPVADAVSNNNNLMVSSEGLLMTFREKTSPASS